MRKPFDGDYPITQTYAEHVERRIANGWQYYNGGIDYGIPERTPILATLSGDVSKVEMLDTGYGNVVKIQHDNGLETLYAHLSYIVVSVGQHVDAGQMIGRSGNTGNSTGPHLHFEVRKDGKAIDPQPYLENQAQLSGISGQLFENPDKLEPGQTRKVYGDMFWRLRSTPAKGDNVIGSINPGNEVTIIEAGEWCKVSVTAYIHKSAFEE